MPRQVSWQSVAIKPQPSAHGLGAEAAVAAEAPVGTTSAADASIPQEAPLAVMITAAKNAELFTASPPLLNMHNCNLVQSWSASKHGAVCTDAENSDPS